MHTLTDDSKNISQTKEINQQNMERYRKNRLKKKK